MPWFAWAAQNWFTLLQTLGILSGFTFTCVTLRRDEKSRRFANLMQLTAHHRNIWEHAFDRPKLRRVLSPNPDIVNQPVTEDETLFVRLLILHLNTAYHAIKSGLMAEPEGLGADIRSFFVHPLARHIWDENRGLQDRAFVDFVESRFEKQKVKLSN